SLFLCLGTCLECEHCSGFDKDCTGKLKLCDEGQDTCATILTETIIGKMSRFTIVKSCYQASKCLRSSKRNSFVKVNVNIECSSSPVGKLESKGGKAPVLWSNELPNNQLLAEVFNQPKSRAAVVFNPNPSDIKFKAAEVRVADPSGKPPNTSGKPPNTSGKPTETPAKTTKSTTKKPNPTVLVTATTGDNAHQTVASFLLALSSLLLMNIFL
ncbi:uncharacterized protein LOC113454552, partial [Pseudonaja textilis]|uniref:uncharacterized protein LOC113454552 n=1 Tax=Pseudonaja textilis TaxID=8673 RepID=UPI000EAA4559